jgi:methyl-accepting chemotaxis protein
MLKKLKVGKRLLVAFLIVVILSSFSGIIGVFLINNLNQNYNDTMHHYGFSQGDLGSLGQTFQAQRSTILYIANAKTSEEREKYKEQLIGQVDKINTKLQDLEKYIKTDKEKDLYNYLVTELDTYGQVRTDAIELLDSDYDTSMNMFKTQAAPLGLEIEDTINKILKDKSEFGEYQADHLQRMSVAFETIMIILILSSIGLSIFIAYWITRGVTKPVHELREVANRMAEGDLDCHLDYHGHDELGNLADNMRTMMERISHYMSVISSTTEKIAKGDFSMTFDEEEFKGDFHAIQISLHTLTSSMSNVMSQISQTSDQVASGADQVSSSAQALSQGATEQASSVEELAATINDISQNVSRNAENAQNANKQVQDTENELNFGKERMQNLTDAMDTISSASAEISKVIKTIEDIAFQTNILALNAAVEAARAGEAGKGFAVVANEVRSLANKSQEASKNTAVLIERALESIESGNNIAGETAKSMDRIVTSSKTMAELVYEISTASESQAEAISEVTLGMDQISSVIQTNSATSEESAAASEELAAQAQLLKSLMAKFKLN